MSHHTDLHVCIGIQARSTSKRLPNKISQIVGDKMIIDHVIDNCRSTAQYINSFTWSNHISASVFVLIPEGDIVKKSILYDNVIEGSEHDVLSRYAQMADEMSADFVTRITADCPLIPPFLIYKCINSAMRNNFDYFSNVGDLNGESMRTSIDGHDVEVLSRRALDWADANAEGIDREHVTSIFRNDQCPSFLRRGILIGHNDHSNIKLSVDTEKDLERVRDEYDKIQEKIQRAEIKYGRNSVYRF